MQKTMNFSNNLEEEGNIPAWTDEILCELNMSQGRKQSWPDRDSNPGPLAIRKTTKLFCQ